MLSEQEVKNVKEQILKQIELWKVPEEKKKQAREQIKEMNDEQLEDFLVKNNMIKTKEKTGKQNKKQQETECPFCLISSNQLPSYRLDENKASLAVLEINPLSSGHTLVIPKKHLSQEKIPSQAFSLAKKLAKKIKKKLKPKNIKIETSDIAGHGIINIIPFYDEKLERKKADEKELILLQEKLKTKPKAKKEKQIRKISEKPLEKAPKRFP